MSARDLFFPKGTRFDDDDERIFARERLIYNTTSDLLVMMEDKGLSKKDVASRLGRTRSFVSQLLGGKRNMTLATLSDLCRALGTEPEIRFSGFDRMHGFVEPLREGVAAPIDAAADRWSARASVSSDWRTQGDPDGVVVSIHDRAVRFGGRHDDGTDDTTAGDDIRAA